MIHSHSLQYADDEDILGGDENGQYETRPDSFISSSPVKCCYIKKRKIEMVIKLGDSNKTSKVLTSDLSKDYVSMNADYRS